MFCITRNSNDYDNSEFCNLNILLQAYKLFDSFYEHCNLLNCFSKPCLMILTIICKELNGKKVETDRRKASKSKAKKPRSI
uniref:Uncharacterized protein n=1 Tax=Rhizophora mucronata TaxID=61149 RepID=A0A2P2P1L7_RHIMU